jgi:exosortase
MNIFRDLKITPRMAAILAVLAACLGWAYLPTLSSVVHRWENETQYSHGWLVPAFALFLLWSRREMLAKVQFEPSWWGLVFLALAGALRMGAAGLFFDYADELSILPALAGVALLLGGWPALRWSWPGIVFLIFMMPLPFSVERWLSHPLQRIGTIASTYALQTLGYPALAEGNTILLNEHHIGVAEACSGLSMMMIFFALATAFAIIIQRPLLDRIIFLVTAIPIAVLANVVRITVTGILFQHASPTVAENFHNSPYAAFMMMALALGLLALEMWILDHLLVEPEQERLVTFGLPSGAKGVAPKPKPKPGMQPTT